MFERFSDRARRVVVLAQEESRLLNHSHIGTEHLLLGLLSEGEGVAFKALEACGVLLLPARTYVEMTVGRGSEPPSGHIPFTARCRGALEAGLTEALNLGHNYIGTEHLLLGMLREAGTSPEGYGAGADALIALGVTFDTVRKAVLDLLASYEKVPGGSDTNTNTVMRGPARYVPLSYVATTGKLIAIADGVALPREIILGIGSSDHASEVVATLSEMDSRERRSVLAYLNAWFASDDD